MHGGRVNTFVSRDVHASWNNYILQTSYDIHFPTNLTSQACFFFSFDDHHQNNGKNESGSQNYFLTTVTKVLQSSSHIAHSLT